MSVATAQAELVEVSFRRSTIPCSSRSLGATAHRGTCSAMKDGIAIPAEAIGIQAEAFGLRSGIETEARQRVDVRALFVLGILQQVATHTGFGDAVEPQIAMGIDAAHGVDGVLHQVGVEHIEELARGGTRSVAR